MVLCSAAIYPRSVIPFVIFIVVSKSKAILPLDSGLNASCMISSNCVRISFVIPIDPLPYFAISDVIYSCSSSLPFWRLRIRLTTFFMQSSVALTVFFLWFNTTRSIRSIIATWKGWLLLVNIRSSKSLADRNRAWLGYNLSQRPTSCAFLHIEALFPTIQCQDQLLNMTVTLFGFQSPKTTLSILSPEMICLYVDTSDCR